MISSILYRQKFEKIYTTHYLRLYCYAMSITGDREVSRDIVEDVFTRLWDNFANVHDNNIYPYLARSVYHASIDIMRKDQKRREYQADYISKTSQEETDYSAEREKDLLAYRMIASLKPPADTIVTLKYLHGKKYEEIATEMDMSVNTVKKHLVKALKKLRELYNR